jgi:hypothetical protein
MKFREDTVKKIAENAKVAQDVWRDFKDNEKLCECFHLRPTRGGITVVSTLHYAPMRGKTVSGIPVKPTKLKSVLEEIAKKVDVLLGIDTEKALDQMEKFKFKKRDSESKTPEKFIEENAQALFIKGMIMGQDMYEGIDFVASELMLAYKSSKIDIVGYKDNTLYILEMKKGRSLKGFQQTERYAKMINDNKTLFLEVLKNYPHCPVDDFAKVEAIAVMGYAANSVKLLESKAKEAGVGLWFYERSIALRKTTL